MDPPLISLIKSKNDEILDKYCVKIKLCRDLTSKNSDPYKLKMAFFDNGKPEEVLLFVNNFNMTLKALGALAATAKIQYLLTMVCGEWLCKFEIIFNEVGSPTSKNLRNNILSLCT